jgi:CarboxypepD_reg-like domain/TonB-dependent Receptor Plug Domain
LLYLKIIKVRGICFMSIIKTFILFICLLPFDCLAQVSISGRVLNIADNKPVVNVNVFLTNATIGDKTSDAGTYLLHGVKPGKYELVVSIVGFETYHQNLMVTNSNIVLPDVFLSPKTTTLKEVRIGVDHNRDKNLELFKDEFLGSSDLAKDCKILNPEILNLDYDNDTNVLSASSDDFLIIENDALGYKINYLLTDFKFNDKYKTEKEIHYDGSVLFQEMKGTPEQKQNWEIRRKDVYQNSAMHFLRSVVGNKLEDEGFRVYQIAIYANPQRPKDSLINAKIDYYKNSKQEIANRHDSLAYWVKKAKLPAILKKLMRAPLTKQDIIGPTKQAGIYQFGCANDALYVTYNKNHHFHVYNNYDRLDAANKETTVLDFTAPYALIDGNGDVIDPGSITYTGVWAIKRVAELLPVNYTADPGEMADSTVLKNTNDKLKAFMAANTTEKAYLHFDKPYYAAGDTIYFKAYVTSGGEHELSGLSGVLNVDLINDKNNIERSIKLKLLDGVAWGEFALPDSLQKGNYRVRAYTQWMRNDGAADFFEQKIPIAEVRSSHIPESGSSLPAVPDGKADVQFFPEGGSLVTGVRSKVAFKAISKNGLGVDVKGVVVDNENREVSSFASAHLGMGYFYVDAEAGKSYKARLTFADGSQNMVDLPRSQASGIVLSANSDPSARLSVKIQASKDWYQENRGKDYTLLIYSGGVSANFICRLKNPTVSVDIEKTEFPSGIARITLFSPTGEPLSERLVFIKNDDQLKLDVSSDKKIYTGRQKVNIKINVLNKDKNPAMGHFSVSVIDESQVPVDENAENTILTDLLLTSDLKGHVEQPNYYFASNTSVTNDNLDLLMLTQGYRRFEWQQVLTNRTDQAKIYQPETSLELSGTIKTAAGAPVPSGEVTLIATESKQVRDTVADINGNFKFSDLDVTGNPMVILRARKENKSGNVKIEVKQHDDTAPVRDDSPAPDEIEIKPQTAELMQQKYIAGGGGISLKEVKIKEYKRPVRDLKFSANLNGPGVANYVIMSDQLVGCMNIECLKGKIPGAIWKENKLYSARTGERLGEKSGFYPPAMVIIIDGILLSQDSKPFDMLNMNDIYSIEVLESGAYLAIYGSGAMGGALVITTKRGDEKVNISTPSANGLIRVPFKGFYKSRTFYSPKYDHPEANIKKDLRSTICWKPELLTDKDGNISFDYYNADGHGSYRLVIEGIDDRGNIGRQVYRYEIQ